MSTSNTFSSLKADYKDNYLDKARFKKLKSMLQMPSGKATSEIEASKNPMQWLKNHETLNWRHLRGIAF